MLVLIVVVQLSADYRVKLVLFGSARSQEVIVKDDLVRQIEGMKRKLFTKKKN